MYKMIKYSPETQSGRAADLSVKEANDLAKEAKLPSSGSFQGVKPVSASPSSPTSVQGDDQ